jgi:hypothetical protein
VTDTENGGPVRASTSVQPWTRSSSGLGPAASETAFPGSSPTIPPCIALSSDGLRVGFWISSGLPSWTSARSLRELIGNGRRPVGLRAMRVLRGPRRPQPYRSSQNRREALRAGRGRRRSARGGGDGSEDLPCGDSLPDFDRMPNLFIIGAAKAGTTLARGTRFGV